MKARDKRRWLTQARAATTLSGVLAKRPGKTQASRVAFAWYREKDWGRLRELASDADALEDSHEEWLDNAERSVANLRSNGIVVKKVLVDVEAAEAWSRLAVIVAFVVPSPPGYWSATSIFLWGLAGDPSGPGEPYGSLIGGATLLALYTFGIAAVLRWFLIQVRRLRTKDSPLSKAP